MKYSGIGGQAVIEGIMMMKGEDYAVAVRRPDKEIEVKKDTYQSITKKAKILQLPFVRGVFRFADSMIIGMRSLTYSASFFEDDEDAEPGKFEQFLDRVFGEKLESAIMAAVLVISFILAIGIFVLRPVVHKGPPDVLHPRNQFNINNKNRDPDHTFQHCHQMIRCDNSLKQVRNSQRQEHKNTNCQDKRNYQNSCHGDQYSDVYGDPGRYDLDADSEPYYSGSGHCGYII